MQCISMSLQAPAAVAHTWYAMALRLYPFATMNLYKHTVQDITAKPAIRTKSPAQRITINDNGNFPSLTQT